LVADAADARQRRRPRLLQQALRAHDVRRRLPNRRVLVERALHGLIERDALHRQRADLGECG